MKMLTGLLPASEGRAELLGRPVEAGDIDTRMRVGYMSQSFFCTRNCRLAPTSTCTPGCTAFPPERSGRDARGAGPVRSRRCREFRPASLPLGIRQRLQLAAACLHRPEVLILDEPTSGVDPAARDMFWRHLGELARRDRRDHLRLDPFHERGRTVRPHLADACRPDPGGRDAPGNPRGPGAASLEDAFIACLMEATGGEAGGPGKGSAAGGETGRSRRSRGVSFLGRIFALRAAN